MIINILAGGPLEQVPELDTYSAKNGTWVGVDRGVFTLLSKGIVPDIAFGDFDSVTAAEWQLIRQKVESLKKYKPEKNETDMEIALNWAIEQNPSEIRIFGCTGGRLDHLLANIQLLLKPLFSGSGCEIHLIDKQNTVFVKGPGIYKIKRIQEKMYTSFLPLTLEVKGITLEGFKYPLNDCHISIGSTLCISNELINEEGTFSFSEGILIVVRSRD
ncbi:thiamine diphosphokinase [Neobacillus sp. PS3-34]|uniref:thiamine diphosphokinase n=1 Tax=Neobacillus sp. PS3-34 TaxID=3070678 RepID=UPI0027DF4475|nr:thiamine diphosphokinase [Neobacillus sp. PS3-34]WML49311.1 thiamine diphosphokinase [Neobacillus sp. PS3-34]